MGVTGLPWMLCFFLSTDEYDAEYTASQVLQVLRDEGVDVHRWVFEEERLRGSRSLRTHYSSDILYSPFFGHDHCNEHDTLTRRPRFDYGGDRIPSISWQWFIGPSIIEELWHTFTTLMVADYERFSWDFGPPSVLSPHRTCDQEHRAWCRLQKRQGRRFGGNLLRPAFSNFLENLDDPWFGDGDLWLEGPRCYCQIPGWPHSSCTQHSWKWGSDVLCIKKQIQRRLGKIERTLAKRKHKPKVKTVPQLLPSAKLSRRHFHAVVTLYSLNVGVTGNAIEKGILLFLGLAAIAAIIGTITFAFFSTIYFLWEAPRRLRAQMLRDQERFR